MTVLEFIEEVAIQIGDETMARWSGAALLAKLNECRRELRGSHLEAFAVTVPVSGSGANLPNAAATLDVDPGYVTPLLHLVAYRILSEDHEDANNRAMADHHFGRYRMLVGEA